MERQLLKGKVAIVTGGTRGIGHAIVRKYLEEGATVIFCGSREETAMKALAEFRSEFPNGQIGCIWPNLADKADVEAQFSQVVKEHKRIDILVNNAGISQRTSLYDYTEKEYDAIMDLNVKSLFICSQVAAGFMRNQGGGCIINTSSMVSIYGQKSGVMYPASKFAVNGITKSLSRELGKDGIRVNAVAPGVVRTDMVDKLPEEVIKPVLDNIPLRRMADPSEIADAYVFLASRMASYISGVVLSVDGAVVN